MMFIVTLQNGKVLIEGRDVKNWDDIPCDEPILSVSLTDGQSILKSLTNCDFYVCCYEAIAIQSCGEGALSSVSGEVTSQQLYGIRSHTLSKKLVQQIKINIIKEIEAEFYELTDKILIAKARRNELKDLENKVVEKLQQIKNCEVEVLSLGIAKKYLPITEYKQADYCRRDGISYVPTKNDETILRKELKPCQ